ncbi:Rib/alpha-like domain-containing protein, partial [Streptococcus parasanguinis]|uniref:Rib/alpha-like domain-containing protein n=1 Tax=Streptococcus parasanguinis TaxID=1318 RepID=UPI00066A7426
MYFNRKNTEQKNWRMVKKGKHFLFGCSLVLTVGAVMASSSVKADETTEATTVSTVSNEEDATSTSGTSSSTYSAPAETVSSTSTESTSTSATTVESSSTTQKEADSVQAPSLTAVADTSALTAEEISNVTEAIKGSNPTAVSVQVSNDGSAVVTFADGSSATLSASQTIKDGSQVSRVRTTRALRSTATRATEGSENLDYTNKEDVEGYVKISYEVDKANNVIHWTVLDNPGQKGNSASGYVYFTIPKDSVGAPTNWSVVQKDKNGKITDTRNYWKDNDGSYLMGQKGRMDTYTGTEMTKRLTELFKKTKNPAIKGNEAAVAAQTAERSQALYTLTADNNKIRNVMWTITFDTPILDKTKPLDFVAGMQGTGLIGGPTNIMTGFTDNFIEEIKFQAVAVKENYTAKVGGSFDADPAKYVTNKAGTPEFPNNYRGATTFAWKDGQAPTATTPGTYTKTVVVTYPAHYKQAPQEVTVTFEVQDPRTDAEKNEPTAKAQTVTPGSTPNAQDSIGNVSALPSGTTFAYKTPVDTTTEGE